MQLETVLRSHGHRVTRPRQIVWTVLSDAKGHLNAQEVAQRAHELDPGLNVSSVYRALTLFTEIDLARESRLGDASTWERAHSDAHIHLMCSTCGQVIHHYSPTIDQLPSELGATTGFAAQGIDVRVSGVCADCRR